MEQWLRVESYAVIRFLSAKKKNVSVAEIHRQSTTHSPTGHCQCITKNI